MPKNQPVFSEQDLREVYNSWQPYFDFTEGGHARAPKFPLPNNFLFLLRFAHHAGEASADKIVRLTLDKICRGGIYDQLGGGFSRYSVDAQRSEEHTSELQSLMRISYAVFCLKQKYKSYYI